MNIIDGKKIADQILNDLEREIKQNDLKPALAVILTGDNQASEIYVRLKEKTAKRIGIRVEKYLLSGKSQEEEILKIIESANQDSKIHGILVQMPLPRGLSPDRIVEHINPLKDVDGFLKQSKFDSPFVLSIWQTLNCVKESLRDKKMIALVNSDIFGQNLKLFFSKKQLELEYILINQGEMGDRIKQADVLITALGKPGFINGSMIKHGSILIDGGIAKKDDRVIGDIDPESVSQKASWLSPVPGGLGPITVACLLKNVVKAITD